MVVAEKVSEEVVTMTAPETIVEAHEQIPDSRSSQVPNSRTSQVSIILK
jgi:hypothetical protein